MAQYTPHTWSTGDTLTAAQLNALEAAAAAAAVKADADAAYDAKGAATAAQTAAVAAAATDATTKASGAQSAAIAAAATDATTKANAAQAAAVQRANHTGTQSADTLTDGTTNKAYTAAEKTKLAGVATAATANATDAQLRDRSTHTGTQAASTVTGLSTVATTGAYTDLTGKPTIPAAYTDAQAVAANASALAGKAPQLTPTATKTAAYTAAVGDLAVMNVAGGATALTLPIAPADKAEVGFLAIGATAAAPLTVTPGGTDTLGASGATSVTAVLSNEVTVYQYQAASTRWLPVANVKPQAALDGRYSALGVPVPANTVNPTPQVNAVAARAIASINNFLRWLNAQNVKGAVSEMSIPVTDTARWSEVGEAWFRAVEDYDLPILQWTSAGLYDALPGLQSGTFSFGDSAMTILRHSRSAKRGFLMGGAVGIVPPGSFNNTAPLTGANWLPPTSVYPKLAAAGVQLVRLPFRWETLQPTLLGALDPTELARITTAVAAANAAGIKCVLDVHNYASYITASGTWHLGDGNLTQAHLVDLWTRISAAFKGNPGVAAYELMNEPSSMPGTAYATTTNGAGTLLPGTTITVASTAGYPASPRPFGITLATSGGAAYASVTVASATTLLVSDVAIGKTNTWASGAAVASPQLVWEAATQAVVTAIRGNADTAEIWVPGYYFQNAAYWPVLHPQAWITDSASATRYVAHNYWSSASQGDSYYQAWATELSTTVFNGGGGYAPLPGVYPSLGATADRIPLQVGETTIPRGVVSDTNQLQSGVMFGTVFIAGRTEAITKVTMATGGTAAGATPTVCRIGIYRVNTDQSLTLEAATANDTTLFAATFTSYTRTLSSTFYKQAGVMYAVCPIVVSAAALPKLKGNQNVVDTTLWPWPCFRVFNSLTDLPQYVPRGIPSQGYDLVYASLTP